MRCCSGFFVVIARNIRRAVFRAGAHFRLFVRDCRSSGSKVNFVALCIHVRGSLSLSLFEGNLSRVSFVCDCVARFQFKFVALSADGAFIGVQCEAN